MQIVKNIIAPITDNPIVYHLVCCTMNGLFNWSVTILSQSHSFLLAYCNSDKSVFVNLVRVSWIGTVLLNLRLRRQQSSVVMSSFGT